MIELIFIFTIERPQDWVAEKAFDYEERESRKRGEGETELGAGQGEEWNRK